MRTMAFIIAAAISLSSLCFAEESMKIDWDAIPEDTKLALYECQQELNQNHYQQAIEILDKFQKKIPRETIFSLNSISEPPMPSAAMCRRVLNVWKRPCQWKHGMSRCG